MTMLDIEPLPFNCAGLSSTLTPPFYSSSSSYYSSPSPSHQPLSSSSLSTLPVGATYLCENFTPSDNDVMCGRGKTSHNHIGNKKFRDVIENNLQRYLKAINKVEKSNVVTEIMNEIRSNCRRQGSSGVGGGFIKEDEKNPGVWFEIGDTLAREKIGHALRDAIKNRRKRNQRQQQQNQKSTKTSSAAKKQQQLSSKKKSSNSNIDIRNQAEVQKKRASMLKIQQRLFLQSLKESDTSYDHEKGQVLEAIKSIITPENTTAETTTTTTTTTPSLARAVSITDDLEVDAANSDNNSNNQQQDTTISAMFQMQQQIFLQSVQNELNQPSFTTRSLSREETTNDVPEPISKLSRKVTPSEVNVSELQMMISEQNSSSTTEQWQQSLLLFKGREDDEEEMMSTASPTMMKSTTGTHKRGRDNNNCYCLESSSTSLAVDALRMTELKRQVTN